MVKKQLIVLDMVEHDTVAALNYILKLCDENKISGMIFALAMKNERSHPHITGSTGRLATNLVEAAGVGSMLQLKLSQQAMERLITE